jgi:septum formation protein
VSRVVLASASPARLATLRAAGIHPDVVVSGVDESLVRESDPALLVSRLAARKAHAVVERLGADPGPEEPPLRAWVLGCDSVLAFDGEILGRPADAADAVRRWQRMRGGSGVLHTGHCLVELGSGTAVERAVETTVHFAELADEEIEAYVATGEPLEVAGAFTVDGLGGPYVTGVEGDHHNVVGLSLPVLREMFAELGVAWHRLWQRPTGAGGSATLRSSQCPALEAGGAEEDEPAQGPEPRKSAQGEADQVG